MTSNRFAVMVLAAVFALPAVQGHGAEKKKAPGLMQQKLHESQKVMEGIALGDFDMIAKHAQELSAISKKAEWRVVKTPQYEIYYTDFQRTADTLAKNAKDKNIDAAALTFMELTLSCVKCHKHLREVRMTRLEP